MKRYIQFLTLVLAAAAISACAVKETATEDAIGKEIKFQAGIGSFQAKATDTAFEKGDEIGLFADAPVSATNVRLTSDGESLAPDSPLYWGLEQDVNAPVAFYAYFPYAAGMADTFTFAVAADQGSAAALAAADLMLASTAAAPADGTVRLNFGHRMSRAIITVDNRLSDAAVTGVTVSGVLIEADVDIKAPSVAAKGQPATVKAAPVSGADGTAAWAVILPPQEPQALVITVTLADGTSYDIPAQGAVLDEGYSYNVSVYLDQTSFSMEFSAGITDWLEEWIYNDKINDPGVQPHAWAVSVGDSLTPMSMQEDGLWHAAVMGNSTWISCQIVRDGGDQVWGNSIPNMEYYLDPQVADPQEILLAPNGIINLYSPSGLFDFTLDASAKKLYVKYLEPKWELLGTGKFIDGFVTSLFNLPYEEFEVDVYTEEHTPNVYRIMDPYKNWSLRDLFTYEEGAYLDLVVREDGNAYFKESYLGLSYSRYGKFSGLSLVEENGRNQGYYGYYYPQYGFIEFPGQTATYLWDFGTVLSNHEGYMCLTLPGGTRIRKYTSISNVFESSWIDESDGSRHFSARVNVGMDIVKLRYGLYSGTLSREEVYGNNQDGLYYTQVVPDGTPVDIDPGYDNIIEFTVPASGTYTLVLCGEDKDGQTYGTFGQYWILYEGDEAPEASATITATPLQPLSDIMAKAHVDFKDPDKIYLMAVPEDTWTSWGMADDKIYDYVLSNGESKSGYYVHSQNGVDYYVDGLEPETSYRVLLAGSNKFGMSTWAQATVTTGATPEFTSIGKGNYHDNFHGLGEQGNHAGVEILKAETTPVRYRVVDPYKDFWASNADAGFYSKYIDFYMDGDQLVYAPYYNGYYEPNLGPVKYLCYNPSSSQFYPDNRILQEGVYNFAPYAQIEGTSYYYPYNTALGEIYLEMPGYTYTPEQPVAGAPKRSMASSAVSGVALQTELRPFTRHMLGTTAKVVERAQELVITAEPLK